MVSIFLAQALTTGRIEVKGSVERFRDSLYVGDVVEAWFRAATWGSAVGRTLNVGTGFKTTVSELLQRTCNLVPGASYYVRSSTLGDQSGIYADVTVLKDILAINTFLMLDAGLVKFAEWAREHLTNCWFDDDQVSKLTVKP